jgi:hypothetical protein
LMTSCPPRPTMQSAPSVPFRVSLFELPMITFSPEALQKAVGLAGEAVNPDETPSETVSLAEHVTNVTPASPKTTIRTIFDTDLLIIIRHPLQSNFHCSRTT